MYIGVDAIPEGGKRVQFGLGEPWAVQAARASLEAEPTALEGTLRIQADDGRVVVSGSVRAVAERSCERCDAPFDLVVETDDVDLTYAPAAIEADQPGEVELDASELDVGWYEQGRLSLEQVLSEALALALPPRIVCTDVAGCDERTREILAPASDAPVGHPGFAALKNFK